MMLLSCLVFLVITWYVSVVWPWQLGLPKSFHFPFTSNYWFPKNRQQDLETNKNVNYKDRKKFEDPPQNSKIRIQTQNLTKRFNGQLVVRNVFLDIYDRHINVLLGHNNAGKTMTLSLITGIFEPTSGTVMVDGFDIRTHTKEAKKNMGMCTKDNCFYPELTVEEHLEIFAVIKGCASENIATKVNETLDQLNLDGKVLAGSLSLGLARKLMLGIATVNDSQILIIDQPTTGIDPESRRFIWDYLLSIRQQRIILLSTNNMEEADTLGDRISILNKGSVVCSGTSMFLKRHFKTGYRLRIAKHSNFDGDSVDKTITKHIPTAIVETQVDSEVVYLLAEADEKVEINKKLFADLFADLEKNKTQFGIECLGMKFNTIKDVFLKVDEESTIVKPKVVEDIKSDAQTRLKGSHLWWSQFSVLFKKRFQIARRGWLTIFIQIFVPFLIFFLALYCDYIYFRVKSIGKHPEKVRLSIKELFGPTEGFISNNDTETFANFQTIYNRVASRHAMAVEEIREELKKWALKKAFSVGFKRFETKNLIGLSVSRKLKSNNNLTLLTAWFNGESPHTLPLTVNMMYEALANFKRPENDQISISVVNQPVKEQISHNVTCQDETEPTKTNDLFNELLSTQILFAFIAVIIAFITSFNIVVPTQENHSKAKFLQLMTGLPATIFWLSNYIFDFILYSLAIISLILLYLIYNPNHTFKQVIDCSSWFFLTLFFFGLASIPMVYSLSLLFKKAFNGFLFSMVLLLIGSCLTSFLILSKMTTNFPYDHHFHLMIDFTLVFLRFFPTSAATHSIHWMDFSNKLKAYCRRVERTNQTEAYCAEVDKSLTSCQFPCLYQYERMCCKTLCQTNNVTCYESLDPMEKVRHDWFILIVTGIAWFAFICFFDARLRYKLCLGKSKQSEVQMFKESDVDEEKERIIKLKNDNKLDTQALAVIDLTKTFAYKTVVAHLTFGVRKAECFGLLGVNGAGKTTIFRMLIGDLAITSGDAFINGLSSVNDLKQFQQQVGFCPQFDALLTLLSVKEMLHLFARLRGLDKNIDKSVNQLIEMVDIENADKLVKDLNGGDKRKLSLALAMIGSPPVLLLDEPTLGVDASGQRKMWSALNYVQKKLKTSVVLTSHSMDECETICSRMAILANGQFRCLGSAQHLKSKFGQGFDVQIKLPRDKMNNRKFLDEIHQQMLRHFPSTVQREHHQTMVHYHISDNTDWSSLFRQMEQLKESLGFEDYAVSDTSLEQIFLSLTR